jgi:hypothetical protein
MTVHLQTNPHTGTRIDEIEDGIYRINTPIDIPGGLGGTDRGGHPEPE